MITYNELPKMHYTVNDNRLSTVFWKTVWYSRVFMVIIKYHSLAKVFNGIWKYLKQTLIP